LRRRLQIVEPPRTGVLSGLRGDIARELRVALGS
jgi:hypothetical protein